MKSKEIKTKIELNIGGERISLDIPFSQQDFVRNIEAEMRFKLKEYREKYPDFRQQLVRLAYFFAASFFSLKRQHDEEIAEAEELLRDASRLCGEEESFSDDPSLNEQDFEESEEY